MPGYHNVQFPPQISYGATGGPRFRTVVVGSEAGYEQRLSSWDHPRLVWEVGHQITDAAKMNLVLAFFRARKGRAHSFRFKDWSDYSVGMNYGDPGTSGLAHAGAAAAQSLGVGDGVRTVFQLVKTYDSGGAGEVRTITKPVAATVKVYVGGVERTSGWTLNAETGALTFGVAPATGAVVAWAGQFDVHARFDTDEMKLTLEGVMQGAWPSIAIIEVRE